jgi:hypothetical protein
MPMRPMILSFGSGQPAPCTFTHDLPASTDFHNPLFGPPPLKPHQVRRRW